jgi:hypothetical protein
MVVVVVLLQSLCINQTPRHVPWFVSECMKLRETMPDLARHFEGYHKDMSPYDGDA